MIVENVIQGTPEWLALKAGIPSPSNFDKIITSTGKPSTQADAYLNKLIVERLLGPQETFKSEAMEHGNETEELARAEYGLLNGIEIEQVGFVWIDGQKKIGCSPDGLVGDDGGLEIKCPLPHTHIGYLRDGRVPSKYIPQIQGNLWITNRKWWDFFSFCEGIKPLQIRVYRDDEYISILGSAVLTFAKELENEFSAIK